MPLTLVPPKAGRTPNYHIRGSYLGIALNRSAKTPVKDIARRLKKQLEQAIEQGSYQSAGNAEDTSITFLAAAVAYMKAGGQRNFLGPIIEHAGPHSIRDKVIEGITQTDIDNLAGDLYPNASSPTRNRQVYAPVAAVLHRAGDQRKFKRPKGWRGSRSISKLEPENAFALLAAADEIDREFGLLCCTLLYTGRRIGETLNAKLGDLNLDRSVLYLRETKNGDAVEVHLPPIVVEKFRQMKPRPFREGSSGRSQTDAGVPYLQRDFSRKIFRFNYGSYLRKLLSQAMEKSALRFPKRQRGFHLFCHTYGTWMHRYGKLDTYALARTNRWKDPRSADVYVHTEVGSEARMGAPPPPPPIRAISVQKRNNAS